MNQERGLDTIVNYDAEVPEEMKLETTQTTDSAQKEEDNKEEGSDESIIYDASEFDPTTEVTVDPGNNDDDTENHQRGN